MTIALVLLLCAAAQIDPVAQRPNLLLILADDLGWGDVGHRSHPHLATPGMDAMAAEGVRFERFYAAAPVCSPTRGSFLTGRHPYRYGIRFANDGHLPTAEVTLAERFADAGYSTGFFGKWHVGTLSLDVLDSNRGGRRGLREHYSPPWEHGFARVFATEAKVPTWDPLIEPETGTPFGTAFWTGPGEQATENLAGDASRLVVDRVEPFLRESVAAGKPFLALVFLHAPHRPVVSGPPWLERHSERERLEQHYYGVVEALDAQLTRMRALLRELGVERNTLVLFTSDNGPEGSEGKDPGATGGLRGRKRSLYEGGVRVPGFMVWPARLPAGRITQLPAVTSDVFPTALAAAGLALEGEQTLDGLNLLPLLAADEELARPAPIAFESQNQLALVDGRWKLVHSRRGPGPPAAVETLKFELYDLVDDPSESRDIAQEQAERVASMRAALGEWRASVAADVGGSGE